jgi:hypothetical protein
MYLYHAEALGLGGQITRPFKKVLESQAATSLPMSGGYGKSRTENFAFEQIVSFDAAYTEVVGSYDEVQGAYTTQVSATVENLNIMNMVTADRVVGRISSTHTLTKNKDEASITPIGCFFENLRIAGNPAYPVFDFDTFTRLSTFAEFKSAFEGPQNAAARESMLWSQLKPGCPPPLNNMHSWFQSQKSMPSIAACSLVKDLGFKQKAGIEVYGPIVVVPNFGIVYVCEFIIVHRQRRLNMLRVSLGANNPSTIQGETWSAQSAKTAPLSAVPPVSGGSPATTVAAIDGEMTVGAGSANGSTYPPPGGG